MEKYLRVFKFMFQVLGMIKDNKVLLKPLFLNVVIGVFFSIVLTIGMYFVSNNTLLYIILFAGLVIHQFNREVQLIKK